MRFPAILLGFVCFALAACAGYRLDGAKPAALAGTSTISVPMFRNQTLHPRAESLATSAVIRALGEDGTYSIAPAGEADAVLEGTIEEIQYAQIRSERLDTLRAAELQNTVVLRWTLRDSANPTRILATGSSTGSSRFFVDSNLQTSRNNGLADALQRASDALVSRLANGF